MTPKLGRFKFIDMLSPEELNYFVDVVQKTALPKELETSAEDVFQKLKLTNAYPALTPDDKALKDKEDNCKIGISRNETSNHEKAIEVYGRTEGSRYTSLQAEDIDILFKILTCITQGLTDLKILALKTHSQKDLKCFS